MTNHMPYSMDTPPQVGTRALFWHKSLEMWIICTMGETFATSSHSSYYCGKDLEDREMTYWQHLPPPPQE